MLKKKNRLSNSEFTSHFKTGRRQQSEYFTVVTNQADVFKAAVVVGKKVYKSAVDRNRIRRRIYTALNINQNKNQILLILVKPPFAKLNRRQQQKEINDLIGRVIN